LTVAALRPDYPPEAPYWTREEWSAANPSLWGSSVALSGGWGWGAGDQVRDIFYWHDATLHRVTYDDRPDINPSLYDGTIAWQSRSSDADDWEILYWDGYGVRTITENSVDDTDPSLYERTIAWCSAGNIVYAEIPPGVYWQSPPTPVVVGTGQEPSLYKNLIAYQASDGHDHEIFVYDIGTGETVQITDNDYYDGSPSLFDGCVAWEAYIGDSWEIFYWDRTKIHRLTENEFDDKDPSLWGTGLSTTIAYLERSQSSAWFLGGYVIRARPRVNISVTTADGQVAVTWPSLEGRTYRVEYSDDLVNWKVAAESVPSAGYGETSWTDGEGSVTTPPPSEVSRRFYRVCESE
jgi:hypothetical protein